MRDRWMAITGNRRGIWLWDTYIAVVYLFSIGTTAAETGMGAGRRIGAAAALTCLVLWYAGCGRRLFLAQRRGWLSVVFVAGALVLFGVQTAFVPTMAVILFALYPMLFMAAPLRFALPVAVVATVMPLVSLVAQGMMSSAQVPHLVILPLIGLVVAVLAGTFLVWTVVESEQRADLIQQLEASRAEVARLSHEAGIAAERARLAREIHDTLAQGFTSIATLVQAAESELDSDGGGARRHLELAVRTARENLDEARALVAALAPSALDTSSLEEAVRRQVERLGEETGIRASYRTVGTAAELPTAIEVVLLRAAQEALSNVRRHSGAQTVTVVLRYTDDSVTLSVIDNGTGFTADYGFGLRGMQARAEQVSGTLMINSLPGKGTTLELEVPR